MPLCATWHPKDWWWGRWLLDYEQSLCFLIVRRERREKNRPRESWCQERREKGTTDKASAFDLSRPSDFMVFISNLINHNPIISHGLLEQGKGENKYSLTSQTQWMVSKNSSSVNFCTYHKSTVWDSSTTTISISGLVCSALSRFSNFSDRHRSAEQKMKRNFPSEMVFRQSASFSFNWIDGRPSSIRLLALRWCYWVAR